MISLFSKEKQKKLRASKPLYGSKVAVVAIAKDEAPYLHEWIHHCLFMGFAEIFIAINRTSDSSTRILEQIARKFPQVHFYDVTWLDQGTPQKKNPQMQALSYAFMSDKIKHSFPDITHVYFSDIDEFWYSSNFFTTISEFIDEMPAFDTLSFHWHNQSGDLDAFEKPFKNNSYTDDRHMKSVHALSTIQLISEFRCHSARYSEKVTHIDASGSPIKYGEHDQVFKAVPSNKSGAFVLHRMLRSELEYTALLLRERPGVEIPIKNNRSGFSTSAESVILTQDEELRAYWDSLDTFVAFCDLEPLLNAARYIIVEKSKKVLSVKPNVLIAHLNSYFNVLSGTPYYDEILNVLESGDGSYLIDEYAKKLFDAGVKYEAEGNIEFAYRYFKLASIARPKGPVIKENLLRVEKLISG